MNRSTGEGGELAARLARIALVPVIEIPDPRLAGPLADALLAAGLPCAEITFRTPGAAAAIRAIAQRHPDMLVGAGTVLSPDQADQALDAGARFLVSPGFSPAVVSHALDRGAVMLPGVCTPTEVEMARAAGIELVKFFPAEPAGGVPYLQALTAPYPSLRFVPGQTVRNGLNFTERGFGVRGALGCADRGHTAAAQLRPGDIPWAEIFSGEGARWFHTGGIFAALSPTTAQVAAEAMAAARRSGTIVSYDLNYRPSLWAAAGGPERAQETNAELVGQADVLFGNEEDYTAALGFPVAGTGPEYAQLDPRAYGDMLAKVLGSYPNLRLATVTLRRAVTASRNDWGAICRSADGSWAAPVRIGLEIYDRVGGGDSFASGFIYALLAGGDPQRAVELGAAHGALAMTTPGDASMATRAEVERLAHGGSARIER